MKMKRYALLSIALLMTAMLMLSACAAPAEKTAPAEEVTVESCTAEVPETPVPTAEPWAGYAINSPELAEQTAREEIEKLQELGIFNDRFYLTDKAPDNVMFLSDEEFLDRTDSPFFVVHWYCDSWYGNNWEGDNRYSVRVNVDANTGKLMMVTVEASADENAEVSYTEPVELEYFNEETGQSEWRREEWLYHENFSDLFDDDMTVNRFCDLLNEYWGFDGWKLGGGGALNLSVPLRDMTAGTKANYYVAFTFEGDEPGKHMYLQLNEFPGRICLMFGTGHAVG